MSETNPQTVLPQTQTEQPTQPDYKWMTMAIESDPDARERIKNLLFSGQQPQPQPQQPTPVVQDPIKVLEDEIAELRSKLPPSLSAAVQGAGGDVAKAQQAAADFWENQATLTTKLNNLTQLRNENLASYEAKVKASNMLPDVIRQAGPSYQSIASSQAEIKAFEAHLDQLGLPPESRMNPLVIGTVAGNYLYMRANAPKPSPSLATAQGGVQPQQAQAPSDIQVALAAYAGVDVNKLLETQSVTLGPKSNMTVQQKRSMMP